MNPVWLHIRAQAVAFGGHFNSTEMFREMLADQRCIWTVNMLAEYRISMKATL